MLGTCNCHNIISQLSQRYFLHILNMTYRTKNLVCHISSSALQYCEGRHYYIGTKFKRIHALYILYYNYICSIASMNWRKAS